MATAADEPVTSVGRDAAAGDYCAPDAFRNAMRNLAGAVTIVTTHWDGVDFGMIATSVTSLSAEPPSLLVCVNRTASSHAALARSGRFCVYLLSSRHLELPEVFSSARRRASRFREGTWTLDECSPRLSGAHALFHCFTERMIEHHSHTIFVGGVPRIETTAGSDPLLYHQAAYHRLIRASSLDAPATSAQSHSLL
jgi:flavin reductase